MTHATAQHKPDAASRRPSPMSVQATPQPVTSIDTHSPLGPACGACACGGDCPRCKGEQRGQRQALQAKLNIGSPNDTFELEADRISDKVAAALKPPESAIDAPAPDTAEARRFGGVQVLNFVDSRKPAPIQRKCACSGKQSCRNCAEDEQHLQRKTGDLGGLSDRSERPGVLSQMGSGSPLPAATRAFMEGQFGSDFSGVRIHDNSIAAATANTFNARAFTVGTDIVFASGRYAPYTLEGTRLLAHELTHVIQQGVRKGPPILQRAGGPGTSELDAVSDNCTGAVKGRGAEALSRACPRASYAGTEELARWHFCLDSDQIVATESLDQISALINRKPISTRYLIHGNASVEGNPDYNLNLACHRANKVADAVAKALENRMTGRAPQSHIAPTIRDKVQTATRGATSEFGPDLASNRVVVLYADTPGAGAIEEPDCKNAPHGLGDIKPETPCNAPTMTLEGRGTERNLAHFRFCLDSDVMVDDGPAAIVAFANRQSAESTYVIHGFASTEGDSAYNKKLSCHRALRVARELMNVGVRSERIREVSGVGETSAFSFGEKGFEESDRVALVLAEHGNISKLEDGKRASDTVEEKLAVVDEAKERLLAGQYASAADFYISYWTCGRTPSVRQAVERLSISVPDHQRNEQIRDQANGIEEGALGTNAVMISNTAIRADNPIECVMGRLIDMALHHAVLRDPGLSADLTAAAPKRDPLVPKTPTSARHLAGLHLISLAGLSACRGGRAPARDNARGPIGIDEPITEDPRKNMPPPACARAPQPTRLLPPTAGEKNRPPTDFAIYDQSIRFNSGKLKKFDLSAATEDLSSNPAMSVTAPSVVNAAATVLLIGESKTFADYEIGFMQTVLDDLFIAEYVSGHLAVQKLPTPIRAAHLKGSAPAPAPWMETTAAVRPDSNGRASVKSSWNLHTEYAALLNVFRPTLASKNFIDTWQRHTRIGIWLVARRLAAPLDRFSAVFLDGSVYEINQNLGADITRIRGDMKVNEMSKAHTLDPNIPAPERETFGFSGEFRASQSSATPADSNIAQFDTPVAADVDAFRQLQQVLSPPAPPTDGSGLTLTEYTQVVREILDGLTVSTTEQAAAGSAGTSMPRLGFIFSRLSITVKVDPATGRMIPYLNAVEGENPVDIRSPGLGDRALYHLARALALRLEKRDFLKKGRGVILAAPPPGGVVSMIIEPLRNEPDLSQDAEIRREMAEMWACSEQTRNSPDFLFPKEFAESYGMDRDGNKVRFPAAPAYFVSTSADNESLTTNIRCPTLSDGLALGTLHTHPIDDGSSHMPSETDVELANSRVCGRQHYVVSDEKVVAYFSDGSMKDLGDRKTLLPQNVPCNQSIPPEVVEI